MPRKEQDLLSEQIDAEFAEQCTETGHLPPGRTRNVAQTPLTRALKDFLVVDGKELCAGAACSTRGAVLRELSFPSRTPRQSSTQQTVRADPSMLPDDDP